VRLTFTEFRLVWVLRVAIFLLPSQPALGRVKVRLRYRSLSYRRRLQEIFWVGAWTWPDRW
jgi:hypothetical protein